MKRSISILLVCILILVSCLGCSSEDVSVEETPNSGKKIYTIGTASQAGSAYQIGSAIATLLNNHMDDVQFTVQATAGSNQDIEFMRTNEVDMGVLINLGSVDAWNSQNAFEGKEPATYLRNLIYVGTWAQHILVPNNSGIDGISDLRGKKVSVGSAGSGVEDVTRRVCSALDMDYLEGTPPFTVEYMAIGNASESLANGLLDAAFDTQVYPASAHTSAMSLGKLKLLSYTDEQLKTVMAADPVSHEIIPAGTYPNQDYDVSTIGFSDHLAVKDSLPKEIAYQIVKTILENIDELHEIYPNLSSLTSETAMYGMTIPAHEGAIQYYEEIGLEVPDGVRE